VCPDENVLKVRIYGAELSIRSLRSPLDANSIVEYVDNKMREVDKNVRVDSSLKVAILAALNIADELFKEREDKERIRILLEDKIRKLNARIDQQLSKKTH